MVKIVSLQAENVKRIKAVEITPTENGLTIIGGRNGQGKTSVLDSIAWVLGGNKMKPSNPKREDSVIPPVINITLSNGLKVERKGTNSTLKVTDLNGNKQGQALLDSFIEELAINLPKFMESKDSEKAKILLQIIGVGDELAEIEKEEVELYNDRQAIGRIADQKKKYAQEQIYYKDIPNDYISVTDLIKQQQEILARNGINQEKRNKVSELSKQCEFVGNEIQKLKQELAKKEKEYDSLILDLEIANTDAKDLQDEDTKELELSIANTEEINRKVRANKDKEAAEAEAKKYKDEYDLYTDSLEAVRKRKIDLLQNADLPLPELFVNEGVLTYKGQAWDNMSGSEQLKVATAIVRKLKPECQFVLIDKLEQMDNETLQEFNEWLIKENLQAIATKVSTGDECSIIIEDGYVKEVKEKIEEVKSENSFNWKGEFK